jgi:hypothetical protein
LIAQRKRRFLVIHLLAAGSADGRGAGRRSVAAGRLAAGELAAKLGHQVADRLTAARIADRFASRGAGGRSSARSAGGRSGAALDLAALQLAAELRPRVAQRLTAARIAGRLASRGAGRRSSARGRSGRRSAGGRSGAALDLAATDLAGQMAANPGKHVADRRAAGVARITCRGTRGRRTRRRRTTITSHGHIGCNQHCTRSQHRQHNTTLHGRGSLSGKTK